MPSNDNKFTDTLMLRKWFNSEQESRNSIRVAIIAGLSVTLITMFGSWAVWTTSQGFKAKLNETKIVELQKDLDKLEVEYEEFKEQILNKIIWVE
jgi:hypothetical protein